MVLSLNPDRGGVRVQHGSLVAAALVACLPSHPSISRGREYQGGIKIQLVLVCPHLDLDVMFTSTAGQPGRVESAATRRYPSSEVILVHMAGL